MELSAGDFIYHNHYGVGRVQEVEAPVAVPVSGTAVVSEVKVRFQNGEVKSFTSELLERSARKISPNGFRAYAYLDSAGAAEMLVADAVEVITMVLQDFPGLVAKNEDIKEYLAEYIPEWDRWWETAQPKLKESPRIDTTRSRFREYGLHHDLVSPAEELYRSFHRIRAFEDRSIVYDQARRTLAEYGNGSSLSEEHLQDVLNYVTQIIEVESNDAAVRIDAIFRLQEGKWLTDEEVSKHLSRLLKSGIKLYRLDLYSLNRTVEFLIQAPPTGERMELLASAICSGEPTIKALCAWALERGEPDFIVLLLRTALSENIPPQLDVDDLDDLAVRLKYAERLITSIAIENTAWTAIISSFRKMIASISSLEIETVSAVFTQLMGFSKALHERIKDGYPGLALQIVDGLLSPANPRRFVLGLLDSARKAGHLAGFGELLEEHLWSAGEGRNYDFIRDLIQSKHSPLEQVKALVEIADQTGSLTLKGHAGALVCEIVRNDDAADPVLFLPYLNQLHNWGDAWHWSQTLESLRESTYLHAMEGSPHDFGDEALWSAVSRYLESRSREMGARLESQEKDIQQRSQRIEELELRLKEREQVIRELRGGYGGDTGEARFNERTRIAREIASTVAEFERMQARMTDVPREIQAVLVRLNSMLAGLNVLPMEAIGSRVEFNPQRHQAVDASTISVGEAAAIVERGFLMRDNNEKLRLLKPSLVRKYQG